MEFRKGDRVKIIPQGLSEENYGFNYMKGYPHLPHQKNTIAKVIRSCSKTGKYPEHIMVNIPSYYVERFHEKHLFPVCITCKETKCLTIEQKINDELSEI